MNDPILQILVQNGYLDEASAQELADTAKTEGKSIRQAVLDQEILSEDDLLGVLAAYQDTEAIDLGSMTIDTEVTEAIPASTARMYNVFPVAADDSSVTLATFDLVDPRISDEMLFTLSKEVRFVFAREKDVMDRISQYYGDANDSVADMIKSLGEGLGDDEGLASANVNDIASMENAANSSAIIRFVNLILYQGVVDHASDIHIEPFENDFKIRYRVDGALYEMKAPDVKMAPAIISRVKILSNLNIAERRIPQDGRIALTVAGRPVDLRVSCLPTAHGESVVMRILDQTTTSLDLENVGFAEDIYEQITMDIEKPNGIFIVTGPTGSGKTTTLYSVGRIQCRRHRAGPDRRTRRQHVRQGAPRVPPSRPRRDDDRRDPRPRDGRNRRSGRAYGPLRLLDAAHERRRWRGHASHRHECRAIPPRFDA